MKNVKTCILLTVVCIICLSLQGDAGVRNGADTHKVALHYNAPL